MAFDQHSVEPIPPPEQLDEKLSAQAAELEQLLKDNMILASSQKNLVQSVASARVEADRLRERIRSVQTEGDIEIRIKLDKYSKLEADIRSGDAIKKELREAQKEAQSLKTAKTELTAKIEQATKELDAARSNIKKIPGMHVQLDNLRQENIRLRNTFEYEKSLNMEKVEQMKKLEKKIVFAAGEVERLRAQLSDAEKRFPAAAQSPVGQQQQQQQHNVQETSGYGDSCGAPQHVHQAAAKPQLEEVKPQGLTAAASLQQPVLSSSGHARNPASSGSSDMSYG